MIQPDQRPSINTYIRKDEPLKNPSNASLMERIKNVMLRREDHKEKESLTKHDYGTFPLG